MSEKVEAESNHVNLNDHIKWIVAFALVAVSVVANQVYSDVPLFYRVLGIVVACGLAAWSAAYTVKGQAFLHMLKEARIETRKVVWPSKQETMQTTLVVLVVVMIMSLILWMLDSLLGYLISSVIG